MPSGWEWAILVLIALLLFGGSRLPGIGRNAGRAVRTFSEEMASFRGDKPSAGSPPSPSAVPVGTPASPSEPEQN
ncbi:MAG: twin-arginine translocase TatA/TatE family subunit [Propionibacteriaceae bacterium]|jgi:sec-independent protein translocase protein TatA|nr:twin-arginine translocase TatA/TatE family subunit [Propionibacteriaceae bacterium]